MPCSRILTCVASWLWLTNLATPPAAIAADPAAPAPAAKQEFVRLAHDAKGVVTALETAIVTFQATRPEEQGLTVDLVGAVHVGEKEYYAALNEAFTKYDAVLFEMVAPAGTRIAKGAKAAGGHPVNLLQNGLKDMLGLEHQLEIIDYTKENLVHADMSPEGFAKSMSDRGESVWQIMLRMLAHGLAQQAEKPQASSAGDLDLLLALFDKNRSLSLKRIMAEQFADLEGMAAALDGEKGSTLISERNKVALAELTRQIAAGKKHIAIFYGAAHLPNFKRHLEADFALQRSDERWITAWNMTGPASAADQPRGKKAKKNPPQQPPAGAAPVPAAS